MSTERAHAHRLYNTIMPDNIKSNVTAAATTTKIIVVGPVICVCVFWYTRANQLTIVAAAGFSSS